MRGFERLVGEDQVRFGVVGVFVGRFFQRRHGRSAVAAEDVQLRHQQIGRRQIWMLAERIFKELLRRQAGRGSRTV